MIRWLGPDDLAQWRDLRGEALRLYPKAFLTTYDDFMAEPDEALRARLAEGNTLGLFNSDDLVGSAVFIRHSGARIQHRAEIVAFYVRPTHQGQGGAQMMIDALVDHANTSGILQLELQAAASNPRAISFYEKMGFQRFGTNPRIVLEDGVFEDDHFFVRFLDR
ncbi:GNAT family N-acetyltransferase [Litoreibacter roseus]|uniref:N-acetyltransferase domain-containing protein n=1 Tax=Litoreibacter roseus TaxID=2601869 RepID=A0A6N6JHC7_9RHOB|nr:GNAT family N-acetyltransferase [Litoreibacter roseus]GFE65535.1 hypothetical protein KIN_26090 [Litoreibacter roseus]